MLPETGAWFGASANKLGTDDGVGSTELFEELTGRKLAVKRVYYQWDDVFPTELEYWIRDRGTTPILSWKTSDNGVPIVTWADIAAGLEDATIDARADDIKAYGAPLFFSFNHEPEGEGEPGDFVAAYRHVHDRFVSKGVTNLSYVWILTDYTFRISDSAADQWYPGDAYVDVIGSDVYNWYGCPEREDPWTEFVDLASDFYDYGLSKGKPMLLAEWATGEDLAIPGRKAQWITDAAATLRNWPQIKAVSWYAWGAGSDVCGWAIESSQSSLDAFSAMGASSYFNPPPPLVNIDSQPPDLDNSTTATFSFHANVPGSTFTCARDGGASVDCSSPHTLTGLSQGDHALTITALDPTSGQSTYTIESWTVDSVPPVVTITSGPPQYTPNTSATFPLESNEPNGVFECRLDAGAVESCDISPTYSGLADGPHTFSAWVYDLAGNISAPANWSWTVDTVPPVATIVSGPATPTKSKSATFQFASNEPGSGYKCSIDGGAFVTCGNPKTYWVSEGTHTVSVQATDLAGNTGAPARWTWTVDITKPVITITSSPPAQSNSKTASFMFTVSDGWPVTSTCQLDSGTPAPCGAGVQAGYANDSFSRALTDTWGSTDSGSSWAYTSGAQADFDTDGSAGTIRLPTANTPRSAFLPQLWTDQESVARFKLDKMPTTNRVNAYVLGRYDPATNGAFYSMRAGLTPTGTVFLAATKRPAGGVEAQVGTEVNLGSLGSANTWYWVRARFVNEGQGVRIQGKLWKDGTPEPSIWQYTYLDLTSPILAAGRAGLRGSPSASNTPFVLSWDDFIAQAGATYSGLAEGTHTMTISSTDLAGNVATVTYNWTVDTVAPVATINSGPASLTNLTTANLVFVSSETGSTFSCKLDVGAWTSCTSPMTYSGLGNGSHTFQVTATDKAGNVSAPASYTWTVDTQPPTTTIDSGPANLTNSKTATFTFHSNEGGSGFKCSLDGSAFVTCNSPKTYWPADGSHTFKVQATDPAGNTGTPATWTWTIDSVKPTVTITSGPADPTTSKTATFQFASGESGVTYTCILDTNAPTTCVSGITYTNLSIGTHAFQVYATDPAGNVGPAAKWNWRIQ